MSCLPTIELTETQLEALLQQGHPDAALPYISRTDKNGGPDGYWMDHAHLPLLDLYVTPAQQKIIRTGVQYMRGRMQYIDDYIAKPEPKPPFELPAFPPDLHAEMQKISANIPADACDWTVPADHTLTTQVQQQHLS